MFSEIEAISRRLEAGTFEAPVAALGVALDAVDLRGIRGWFGHAGYRTAPSSLTPDGKPI